MNKRRMLVIWTVLLIGIVFVQDTQAQFSTLDNDGDRVCNWARNSGEYERRGIDVRNVRECYLDNEFGDRCPGTRQGENVRRGGINNGCADSQIQAFRNYWSVGLGENSPDSVKVNWLLDQSQGVDFYQEIKLSENVGAGSNVGEVRLENIRVSCDSGEGVVLTSPIAVGSSSGQNFIQGNYKRGQETIYNKGEKSAVLKLKLMRLTEDKVRAKVPGNEGNTIDEIKFECEAIITQNVGQTINGQIRFAPVQERDAFSVRVPIDTLVVQPPQVFLDRGIALADSVVSFADTVLPKLEWVYGFSLNQCKNAVKIVLGGKILGIFNQAVSEFVDNIWFGPKGLRDVGLTKDSFFLSGRSMCAYSVCPSQWCRLANHQVGTENVERTLEDGTKVIVQETRTYADNVNGVIQDSLILSAGCGCVSGLVQNLYQLRATAANWQQCMEIARDAGVYVSDCERVLQQNICEFIVEEYQVFGGDPNTKNLFGKLWDKLTSRFGKTGDEKTDALNDATGSAPEEAGTANAQTNNVESKIEDIKSFGSELATVGDAVGRGAVGYKETSVLRSFCSAAIYGRVPDFITDSGSDVDKVIISTQVSGNWRTGIAYNDIQGSPVHGYEISWMIVAGRDNTRYNVFLRTSEGTKRNLDRGSGVIRTQGDFESDFLEITDTVEYTELCIEIPSDTAKSGCYPAGKFATSGIQKDVNLFFGSEDKIQDQDGDRLPDDWEKKYNCHGGRVGFDSQQDEQSCQDLLREGRVNLLNPSNPDSDGDRIRDDKEDADGDGWDNYQEYLNGGNPNVAGQKTTGELIESQCHASFESFSLSGGNQQSGLRYYRPGENVVVQLNNDKVFSGTTENEVVMRTTITGSNVAHVSDITLDNARGKEVNVWTVPSGADSGNYNIEVEFVKLKDVFGANSCAGIDRRVARKEAQVLIYNPSTIGCLEVDGGKEVGRHSVCMDASNVYAETCTTGTLNEYVCRNDRCEVENVVCSDLNPAWTCVNPGLCGQVCFDNDPSNDVNFIGTCRGTNGVFHDQCTDDGVKQHQCASNGECVETQIQECVAGLECQTQSRNIVLPQISYQAVEKVGVCVAPTTLGRVLSASEVIEGVEATKRNLGSLGSGIWQFIIDESEKNRFEPELILALITAESRGRQNALSTADAVGIMQIVPNSHPNYDANRLRNDPKYNIESGIAILREFSQRSRGSYESSITNTCDNLITRVKFLNYVGEDAALRLYNGPGCGCSTCDDDFVEKVNQYLEQWKRERIPPPVIV